MRIALAEIGQETCSFTSVRTNVDTFRQYGLYEGEEILVKRRKGTGSLAGFFRAVEEEHINLDPVPIISAWAGANGPLLDETLQFFIDKVTAGLQAAGEIDGFFFSLHGAAAAENEPDVEGALLEAARKVLGPDVPIVSPFDHHAGVTRRMIENLDGLVAHRTQPHHPDDTGYWAAKQLFAIVRGDIKPTLAWQQIPMIAHQEQFLTSRGPMKEWFDQARNIEQQPDVVSASTFPMQPWLDIPEGGWTTVVITDDAPELAAQLAADLARQVWEMREDFWEFDSIPPDEAVRRAVAAPEGLVILSDTGDSVFGGATGDSTVILRELVAQEVPELALVTVVDPEVVAQVWEAGEGARLAVTLGGKLDTFFGRPFDVTVEVLQLGEGVIEADVIGRSSYDTGRRALLAIGNVRVVVSENVGVGGNHPSIYQCFGIEPADAKMAVFKTASNFQYFADITAEIIRVDSIGPTMSHLEKFDWQLLPRPIYPLDEMAGWSPS